MNEEDQRCPKCNSYRFYNDGKCTNCGFTKKKDDDYQVFPGFF